jgi:hypothetical protein
MSRKDRSATGPIRRPAAGDADGSIEMLGDWFDPQGRADVDNSDLLDEQVHRQADPQWQNSTVLSGDPIEEIRALEEQPGRDIVVTGSIMLCHTLIEAGLVDEYRLFAIPRSDLYRPGRRLADQRVG